MGRIARILSFLRTTKNGAVISDVKVDPGGGANITAEHFTAIGDDSEPLTTDYALIVDVATTGGAAVVGYLDPINLPKASPGDKRIYARDPETGISVAEVLLESSGNASMSNANGSFVLSPDGKIKGSNANGSFELRANGDFVMNGVTIDASGVLTVPSSLLLDGKEIAGHTHPVTNAPGTTGPNT